MTTANDRLTDQDLRAMERKLSDALGRDHCDVADFACRSMIRLLAEVRALRAELAPAPGAPRNSVPHAQPH